MSTVHPTAIDLDALPELLARELFSSPKRESAERLVLADRLIAYKVCPFKHCGNVAVELWAQTAVRPGRGEWLPRIPSNFKDTGSVYPGPRWRRVRYLYTDHCGYLAEMITEAITEARRYAELVLLETMEQLA